MSIVRAMKRAWSALSRCSVRMSYRSSAASRPSRKNRSTPGSSPAGATRPKGEATTILPLPRPPARRVLAAVILRPLHAWALKRVR
jgi:hypothetical protein